MRRPHQHLPAYAFLTSLLIHAMLLIALPLALDAATTADDANKPEDESVAMTMPVELELGIDTMTPDSDTWIGFEEPQPQKAEQAEIEQAAFTDQPVAAAPPPPVEPTPQVEPLQETVAETTTEEEAESELTESPAEEAISREPTESPAETAIEEPAEFIPDPQEPEFEQPESAPIERDLTEAEVESEIAEEISEPEIVPEPEDLQGETSPGDESLMPAEPITQQIETEDLQAFAETLRDVLRQMQDAMEQAMREVREEVEAAAEARRAAAAAAAALAQPSQPPQEQRPQIAPQAQDANKDIGTPSDRESPATSVIDIPRDQWELGKPLARHGLLLKPRRPEFTLLTLMTSSPGNPLCQMNFDRDGVPISAALLRGTGDKRVDEAVLASLYRWRAEGEELSRLAPGKTLDVQIRIILNKKAAATEEREKDQT